MTLTAPGAACLAVLPAQGVPSQSGKQGQNPCVLQGHWVLAGQDKRTAIAMSQGSTWVPKPSPAAVLPVLGNKYLLAAPQKESRGL